MYQRDIPRLPIQISREKFVDLVFDIGREYCHEYNSIVASVILGDKFVTYTGPRKPFIDGLSEHLSGFRGPSSPEIINELVPQIYSEELAHVVTVLVAKHNEDNGYQYTNEAIVDTENRYIVKMEWEIAMIIGFRIDTNNFVTAISYIIWSIYESELNKLKTELNMLKHEQKEYKSEITISESRTLKSKLISKKLLILVQQKKIQSWYFSSAFWDLSKEICMNPDLLYADPRILIISILLLQKRNKLKAHRVHKERIFFEIMNKLSHELELDLSSILKAYISIKQENTTNPSNYEIQPITSSLVSTADRKSC